MTVRSQAGRRNSGGATFGYPRKEKKKLPQRRWRKSPTHLTLAEQVRLRLPGGLLRRQPLQRRRRRRRLVAHLHDHMLPPDRITAVRQPAGRSRAERGGAHLERSKGSVISSGVPLKPCLGPMEKGAAWP